MNIYAAAREEGVRKARRNVSDRRLKLTQTDRWVAAIEERVAAGDGHLPLVPHLRQAMADMAVDLAYPLPPRTWIDSLDWLFELQERRLMRTPTAVLRRENNDGARPGRRVVRPHSQRWSREAILRAAVVWFREHGCWPSNKHWASARDGGHPSAWTVTARFGGFRQMREQAERWLLEHGEDVA